LVLSDSGLNLHFRGHLLPPLCDKTIILRVRSSAKCRMSSNRGDISQS